MSTIGSLHGRFVHQRRVEVLASHLTSLLPRDASVLDIGCGDGRLAAEVARARPDVDIIGVDTLRRPETCIPVAEFDGLKLPLADRAVDVALFVDVLHHTDDPMVLLREAKRIARKAIVIKDHCCDGVLARQTLRLMDWVGNAHHGVALPYNYWPAVEWRRAISALDVRTDVWETALGLYPWPARLVFERSLHFLAVLSVR